MSLVSNAFSLNIIPPNTPVQWTPVLDGSGNVNWSHPGFTSLPQQTYIEVLNTTFVTRIDQKLRAGSFPSGYQDKGGIYPAAYTGYNDYEGIGWDDTTGRGWMKCGGHSGSWNNGIYRFDIEKMDWFVELEPTNPNNFSTQYKQQTCSITYTRYCDASGEAVPYDIIPLSVDNRNTRTSKHHWGGILPAQDGTGVWIINYTADGRYDFFKFSDKSWTRYLLTNASPSYGMYTFWRPNGQWLATNYNDSFSVWIYGTTGAVANAINVPIFHVSQSACQVGNVIYCFPGVGVGSAIDPSAFFTVDMSTLAVSGFLHITGSVPPHNTGTEGAGSAYIPELGRILITQDIGSFALWSVNPNSPYDSHQYTPGGTPPPGFQSYAQIYNKMHYYPARHILVIPDQNGTSNVRIIKFA